MMQTALDLLAEIGSAALVYFWQPVLVWTVLAVLVSGALERWESGHPLIKYRLYLVMLFALPLGALVSAVTDFSFLNFQTRSPGEIGIGPLTAWAVGVEPTTQRLDLGFLIQLGTGLLSLAAILVAVVKGFRLVNHASALAELGKGIEPRSAREVLSAEDVQLMKWAAPYRDVRIAVVPDPIVPMTFGVFNPIIVLPASLLENPAGLRLAVAHELVHIRRYDALLHWIEEGIEIVFAAWPVVRSVRRHIRTYREVTCDLEVLGEASFSRKAYAQLLGSFSLSGPPQVAASLSMAASPNELKRRISAMRNETFRTFSNSQLLRASLGGAAAMLFTILFIMSCTDLVGPDHEAVQSTADARLKPAQGLAPDQAPVASALDQKDASTISTAEGQEVFLVVEEQPKYPGGMQALAEFLQTEIRYPDIARKAGIEGKVFVQFVVGSDGKISDVQVVRGIGAGCDEEVVRLIKSMPDWIPGRQGGRNVPVRFSMPVTFKLSA